ncbi:hypothetical protein PIB30_082320 [Stylosanthes scabra]|uniref:DDT domain-containing protein n=1 Tax=Stylosanthes scabra TaxID=79078 RepID=A0ABU6YPJ5_9FABA|nr:hypothetical protein [Stylosanthes scabra]
MQRRLRSIATTVAIDEKRHLAAQSVMETAERENGVIVPPRSGAGKSLFGITAAASRRTQQYREKENSNAPSPSNYDVAVTGTLSRKKKHKRLQDIFTPDYNNLSSDGPPVGLEFDSLPSRSESYTPSYEEDYGPTKMRKVSKSACRSQPSCNKKASVKKHGMGKGLMTVWRATNPEVEDLQIHYDFDSRKQGAHLMSKSLGRKPVCENRRNKTQDKRKLSIQRQVGKSNQYVTQNQLSKEKCELALNSAISEEEFGRISMLVDDEELEMRELRAGTNMLICSDHLAASGMFGCSLCKDVLVKFPPDTVKMKKPVCLQPWDSSPEIVKKLFKVFHFLYTYATVVNICPFTLDEFVQSFHDKDSVLLGKIHIALLSLLLSDIEVELTDGFSPHLNKSCNFLALLHSVESQEYSVDCWRSSLNALTWVEILRQVLVASGFGSKQGALRREALSKELNLFVNYGLHPGTLKGELFKILSEQGNNGCKLSELANSKQIVELNLHATTGDLESLICSTLSSDITLFEKISPSAYRLRMSTVTEDMDDSQSDLEDNGSVDDEINYNDTCSSDDDFENDSRSTNMRKLKRANSHKTKNNMLKVYTEIDESHPGEIWLLGLMESEYSDLNVEEKLNALAALTDLLSSGFSIRMMSPAKIAADCHSSIKHGSGAKIKRSSSVKKPGPFLYQIGQLQCGKELNSSFHPCPVDSTSLISNSSNQGEKEKSSTDSHPIQSVFLGSDRRYNRYWLFLGPCNADDPGHRRVYFESSEDGHWEVIDTEEALHALLSALDDRGKREAHLIESLEKRQASLCRLMSRTKVYNNGTGSASHSDQSELDMVSDDSYSPVSDVDNLNLIETAKDTLPSAGAVIIEAGKKAEEQAQKWLRAQGYDSWIWGSFYLDLNVVKYGRRSYLDSLAKCLTCHDLYWRDERHCRICHTTFELDFDLEERYAIHRATCSQKEDVNTFPNHKVLSSQIQSLKAAIYAIESVMPEDALVGAWRKSAHKLWVKRLRRTSSLVELLQVLSDFVALALWLVKLDAIIAPYLDRGPPQKKQGISKSLDL